MSVSTTQSQTRKLPKRYKIPYSLSGYPFNRRVATQFDQWVNTSDGYQMDFKFQDLSNYTEFVALFDQYRIDKVEVTFQLVGNVYNTQAPNSTAANTTNWFPKLWISKDYDGPSGTVDTLAEIKERQDVQCFILEPNKFKTVTLQPKALVQTYVTSGATGKSPKVIKIDTAQAQVEHYGLTYVYDANGLDPGNTQDAAFKVAVERKYYFTMFGVK